MNIEQLDEYKTKYLELTKRILSIVFRKIQIRNNWIMLLFYTAKI